MAFLARAFLVAGLVGLAGCAAPPVTDVSPSLDPTGAPTEVSTTRQSEVSVDQQAIRRAARTFIEVIDTVEPVAEQECRARAPRLDCDFLIVVDDNPLSPPNAFQTLDENGRPIIAFTLSLIADARNADEMAFIMAHEAAHHIAGHLEQQRRNAMLGAAVFGQLAGVVGGGGNEQVIRTAQQIGAEVGARTYSKEFELEADALGTVIAARAGYDPVRGAEFFFRIPDPGDQFLGTHPPNAERVAIVLRTAAGLGL
ncbi:M48 family metallopeptidase [Ponticoccus sp. SC2-23]|uniref:M48 family metallopeptidase n=1 Tax=Alexandriicola marinus TaxID=2081710 RepID=UPI000FD78669|nr:M48 family metallopeptidase [Alexandriicola marinus]MBM1219906.1 M48 family metallopeptidase [Ponticoccus sp. SC6-9]MBM1224592.1 M48 family metallopeptidase [Ponticoccus sp. SC6-15]MBM1228105.1 M48 family metallopeptidase [Ponticoccus sp. SC6-38]MBM1234257.1 M48 family metallopeptidase [Ponticoccus sp. SC6-45]MBM1238607.1 M48 family metallopeptidase [Ponticoccus sp. SC6-49]MBM1242388.1 M48 family metallopeptidase [Ponticoccus sp. SC2-64]MBM1247781.1 M48 family metallopeptidase [Ponticoccu